MNSTIERLNRKLSLIKILTENQGIRLVDLLKYTGHKNMERLKKELGELFMVGSYPYTPADYIEIDFDGDRVHIHLPVHLTGETILTIPEWLSVQNLVHFAFEQGEQSLVGIKQKIHKIIPASEYHDHNEDIQIIRKAIKKQRQIKFLYQGRRNKKAKKRVVDPYLLFYWQGYYLVGYCNDHKGIRNFRVEALQEPMILDESFELPSDLRDTDYVREFRSFIDRANQNSGQAEIIFQPSAWYHLAHRMNLQILTRDYPFQGEQYIHARTAIVEESWFLDRIASYGNAVIILQPKSLVQKYLTNIEGVEVF